jgi:hypothetical protein
MEENYLSEEVVDSKYTCFGEPLRGLFNPILNAHPGVLTEKLAKINGYNKEILKLKRE